MLLLCLPWPQQPTDAPDGREAERRSARSTRVEQPPAIDGRLDDAAWQRAVPIGELTQVEPHLGLASSEPTDIRFLHDSDRLYVGVRCFDSDPGGIVSTTCERDARLDVDDRVEIVFDTFLDRRNAFFFQINAAGSKGDALITGNGSHFNKPWDGIWEGVARVDERGWSAELALPFKTLNFAEGRETWGFNVARFIGRKREESRWTNASRDHRLFNIYRAGDLAGLAGIQQGIGLDLVPFFVSHWQNEREEGDKTLLGEPGFDLFYKLIPSLTFSLTVNTDFAETEVDERQINLTRFPLFFPERRDFFLQDAGVFQFGLDQALIPFFSRRVGLNDQGEEVPILAGAKLTGRAGPWGIGLLDVQTDELDELDGQNLFAARLSKDVGEQSRVGGIVTRGNPAGDGDNLVIGLDGTHRANVLAGDRDLVTTGFFLQSESEALSGQQSAFGLAVEAPGDLLSWSAGALEIQEDFRADLGFVPRSDIRRYDAALEYQPRPEASAIRQYEFGLEGVVFTDTDGELETWEAELQPLGIEFESGEALRLELVRVHDELAEDFEISDGVVIPPGEYDFTRGRIELDTGRQRALSGSVTLEAGDFFDGDRTSYEVSLLWQPGALFNGTVGYEQNDVALEGGDFDAQLALLRANFSFSPAVSWNNLLQWDDESDTIGVQSRLRWIPQPGQEVFLVFDETLESDSSTSTPRFEELSFKVTYALRF
jgi:hypothetical protein